MLSHTTRSLRLSLGFLLGLGVLGGCQGRGPDRVPVAGEVKLDGYPLPTGTITFTPIGTGTAGFGTITDGRFTISQEAGPSPGECKVEILSYQKTGRQVAGMSADGSGKTDETKQVVPDKYSTNSTLKHTLPPGGDLACRFELKSN